MAAGKGTQGAAPKPKTEAGGALFEVIWETAQTFFRLRAWGRREGAVSAWGGGFWGLMHSLAREGPQTVPALARTRPVARQRIQRIADELAAEGLIEFIDNPAHRRSKLLRLTGLGEEAYRELTARLAASADRLAADLDPEDLRTTLRVLRALKAKLTET